MDHNDLLPTLNYGRSPKPEPAWFRFLVLGGCAMGVSIIGVIIADIIRYR